MGGLLEYLNVPSARTIWQALTCRNLARFLTSPLMAAIVFFFGGLYANAVLQVVADRQVVHCGEEVCPPLPDLGHQLFPHLTFVKICDIWLYVFVGSTLLRFSPLFVNYSLSLVMLRRWLFLQGLLFWMRGISVALTRQSVPQEDCVTTALGNPWIEGFYIMSGMHITCGDIMYSGHTAALTLCTLIWTHYSKGEEWKACCGERRPYITPNLDAVGDAATCSLTATLVWMLAGLGFFFIIATHFHYSNDVFIGCIISQFCFRLYHFYIKTVLELPGWWAKLFRWFEGFDTSLLAQIHDGKLGETRRRLLNNAEDEESGHPHSSDSMTEAGQQARINAGNQNREQAVAPLAGVAVAIFSEGPAQANRDQAEREARYGKDGLVGRGIGGKDATSSSTGNTQASRASGGAGLGATHATATGGQADFAYHAMQDNTVEVRAASSAAKPVIVAGEIAQQSPDLAK